MAQKYKIPHRIKTKAIKKLQKTTIKTNFELFMHKNRLVYKEMLYHILKT